MGPRLEIQNGLLKGITACRGTKYEDIDDKVHEIESRGEGWHFCALPMRCAIRNTQPQGTSIYVTKMYWS